MADTQTAARLLAGLALIAALALAVGMAATFALRRAYDVEAPVRTKRRMTAGERLGALSDRVSKLMPASARQLGEARESLMRAGIEISPAAMWSLRVVGGLVGISAGLLTGLAVGGLQGIAVALIATIAGALAPQLWMLARRARWRSEIEAQLPDALDLMTIAMSAGSSFDAAIRCVADEMEGSLPRGLKQVCDEAGYTSRSEALVRFAERAQVPSLTVFTASLAQAEKTGGSVVEILRSQAETVRKQRRLAVEEKAGTLSAKMLVPMILFIFPCFVLIIVTPMFGAIMGALGA